jgi:hypothetical protein
MRTDLRTLVGLSIALSGLAAGCLVPAGAEIEAITMGTETSGDPAVVALVAREAPDRARCTATLVAPRVLLTAAHCELESAPDAWEAFFGTSLASGGTRIPVLFALPHPDYDGDADDDLELVLLAEPAPASPVLLANEPLAGAPRPARLVGFGFTAAGADDADRKREGLTSITEAQPRHVVLGAAPSLPCSADSGGPLFVGPAGEERLTAVVSRGDPSCTSLARATRIDVHLADWIGPTIEAWQEGSRSEGEACLYDAQCTLGACVTALDEPLVRYCGGPCTGDDACEAPMRCTESGGERACRHPLPSPGAFGAACSTDDACVRGECVESEGYCSVRCAPSRDECPSGSTCEHVGSIDFFCVPAPPPSCACRVAPTSLGFPHVVGLALLSSLLVVRARRGRARSPGLGEREAG